MSRKRPGQSSKSVVWFRHRSSDSPGMSLRLTLRGVVCLVSVNASLYKFDYDMSPQPRPPPLLQRDSAKWLTMSVNSSQVSTFTVTNYI